MNRYGLPVNSRSSNEAQPISMNFEKSGFQKDLNFFLEEDDQNCNLTSIWIYSISKIDIFI